MERHIASGNSFRQPGFTFIELMIVLSILALLLSIVFPRYFNGLTQAKETVLLKDLTVMRTAIDHYYNDKGQYPQSLRELVTQKYLHEIPTDPITGRDDTWVLIYPSDGSSKIFNVKSGAQKKSVNGSFYNDW